MTDLPTEAKRLMDDWSEAQRYERSVANDPKSKATAKEMTQLAIERILAFRRDVAATFDLLIRCKVAVDKGGDATLEMVMGEDIKQAIDQRISGWHEIAAALTKKVTALEHEVKWLRKVQLARSA